MAYAKTPQAPGSIKPQGPCLAEKIYPPMSGAAKHEGASSRTDDWRGGPVAAGGQASRPTKGAVPVKETSSAPGNQCTKNSHTQPGAIKPVGSDAAMRKTEGPTSTSALKKKSKTAARRVYPKFHDSEM